MSAARRPAMASGSDELRRYYEAVAPFYAAEMALRDDAARWRAVAATARTVLDLGCGGGRVARLLAPGRRVVGVDLQPALLPPAPGFAFVLADLRALPFPGGAFDLAIAANDPFAHLLADDDRQRALDEACRVARRVVIDGLALDDGDDARAATLLVREARLPGGVVRHEEWRRVGPRRYRTRYRYERGGATVAEASATVRAWSADEPALAGRAARIERTADAGGSGLLLTLTADPTEDAGAERDAPRASRSHDRAGPPGRRS